MCIMAMLCLLTACQNNKKTITETETETAVEVTFSEDSAYLFCQKQCDFGPRIMNSEAHDLCGKWIVSQFQQYGLQVTEQQATVEGYDGTPLKCTNIIASYLPEQKERILICAHWDSRPWADNDPNENNWHTPVMAANDGASGVGVMLEIARLLAMPQDTAKATQNTHPSIGIDFICFDAEDWGTPQWAEKQGGSDTWALGAQYWSAYPHTDGYTARYGILLDMVGGIGSRFYHEGYSRYYASTVVDRVWKAAQVAGYSSFFPQKDGGTITDDHVPVNVVAGIPCIDIIPYYPDCMESSFGPTWHTVNDDMQHLDRNTLKAVGQTIVQVLFSEQ
jgi:hypothetical protein